MRDVAGSWKDLTDDANFMAGTLTGQVRDIAFVTTAVATGDLSKKVMMDMCGELLKLKDSISFARSDRERPLDVEPVGGGGTDAV
ncbi:hypothetical protein [Deinococcus sonorensis]|uniref:Uncharacterized protein n=2 Tax=Deinococcus sonorensis TaxID=309891 RepID=A0AAU7UCB9_9DEIO